MNDIYLFNPTGEMAIANGMVSYMPPKKLRIFEDDLSFLPSFYAQNGDIVVTENIPDQTFLEQWNSIGLPIINYKSFSKLDTNTSVNSIKPWSLNQAIHHKIKLLKNNASIEFKQSPNFFWKDDYKNFFSRATTNKVQEYLRKSTCINNQIAVESSAISLYSIEAIKDWIQLKDAAILKMPWSSSGRGIHVVNLNKNQPINYPWLQGALKQQGFITAELLLNKKFDFSFQLDVKANGNIELLGISYFINDDKGHFTGGNINWPHKTDEISLFLNPDLINMAANLLIEAIKTVQPHNYYNGPIGVDAIVYKHIDGSLKVHPCVDINWRYNMGMINIALPKYLSSDSVGIWKVSSFKPGEWNSFINKNKKEKPLVLSDSKIATGFINMTPPNERAHFGVWMEVWNKH